MEGVMSRRGSLIVKTYVWKTRGVWKVFVDMGPGGRTTGSPASGDPVSSAAFPLAAKKLQSKWLITQNLGSSHVMWQQFQKHRLRCKTLRWSPGFSGIKGDFPSHSTQKGFSSFGSSKWQKAMGRDTNNPLIFPAKREFLQITAEAVNAFKAWHLHSLNAWCTLNPPTLPRNGKVWGAQAHSSITIQETPQCETPGGHRSLQGNPHSPIWMTTKFLHDRNQIWWCFYL